ncbi:MAG: helix-turn-helix transcriptional regulator [Hydrogenovibrio sp.]|uniref:helix-turn-helix transcriptional regulator n=1 Tax=Hydrogenovibrio sp. TaxID=2065821 RepID=UPI00286FF82B|nr:helix-turn-helix transcriptional regulator [Hydrogenovibrio sp.]MDR9498490.1 helix-turn-helix transcriptional regulator [Hydrogenovibrio sp.]
MQFDAKILTSIGLHLEQARLARRLKQSELAERAGVTRQTIGKIESGQSVQSKNLIKAIWALGLDEALCQALAPENDTLARSMAFGSLPKKIRSKWDQADEKGEF